jgi:hypothetical protein
MDRVYFCFYCSNACLDVLVEDKDVVREYGGIQYQGWGQSKALLVGTQYVVHIFLTTNCETIHTGTYSSLRS